MSLIFSDWTKHLSDFAKQINSEITIEKRPVYGDNYELYFSSIIIEYNGNFINLTQTATKIDYENCGASSMTLFYNYNDEAKLFLSLSGRDFFDKVFSRKRIKTENQEFDTKFTIDSSDKRIAENLFKDNRVQTLFLKDPLLVFNISTNKVETNIKLKYMENRLYSHAEMHSAIEDFKYLLGKILV